MVRKRLAAVSLLLIVLLLFPGVSLGQGEASFTVMEARSGELNLHNQPLGDSLWRLDGQWEFHWNKLLSPEHWGQSAELPDNRSYIEVPAIWSEAEYSGGERLTNEGYATYRLVLHLNEQDVGSILALYIPSVASAYQLWIDGQPVAANGVVGTSRATMQPKSYAKVVSFQAEDEAVELVMHVSNFVQRKGGIWSPLKLGRSEVVHTYKAGNTAKEILMAGVILLCGLYYISWYTGIVSVLFFFRTLLVGDMQLIAYFPDIPWEWSVKLEYASFYIGTMFLIKYVGEHYPEAINRGFVTAVTAICLLFMLTLAFPASFYTLLYPYFTCYMLIIMLCMLVIVGRAVWLGKQDAPLHLLSVFVLIATSVNDALYYNHWVGIPDLSPAGIAAFVFIQSYILARKRSKEQDRAEILAKQLSAVNRSLEEKVEERTWELQKSNLRLQKLETTRKQFFSAIAHELGTPLQSISGYIELLQRDEMHEVRQKYLKIVADKASVLGHLVKDLLDLAKMEEGQYQFHFEEVYVEDLMSFLQDRFKLDIERQGLAASFPPLVGLSEDYRAIVCIDQIRLEQVFINLVSNAMKFTPEGGTVRISGRLIEREQDDTRRQSPEADRRERQAMLSIEVADTGYGIEKELLPHVFERFVKGSRQKGMKGSGLGLAICRHIIEQHQGTIEAASEVGKGSLFSIRLPVSIYSGEMISVEVEDLDR